MPKLASNCVVLTRSAEGNAAWQPRLEASGFTMYSLPTIQTMPLAPSAESTRIAQNIATFSWIIFTSAVAGQYFHALFDQLGCSWPPRGPKIAAVGPHTTQQLESIGLHADFVPSQANAETLGRELSPVHGQRILLPRTTIAPNTMIELLASRGAQVTSLPLYTTHPIDTPDQEFAQKLQAGTVGCFVFASPSAVRGFALRVADPQLFQDAKSLPAIAVGTTTASALKSGGHAHIHISRTPTIDGIIDALKQLGI